MEAEIYGIIPNAKTEALANAPPVNALSKPSKPPPPAILASAIIL